MKSDFEKRAAQEVVDAVERRYERNQKAARQMRGRRRLGSVAIAAALVVGGVWLWRNFAGGDVSSLSSLVSLQALSSRFGSSNDAASSARRQYGEALKLLLTGEAKLASEMPDELKIKTAKPGTRYAVLTPPANGWFGIYELIRGSKGEIYVSELSPVRDAKQVKAADLRAATAGKPYLVAVQGRVFLFGSKNLADAAHLRSEVRKSL